MKIAIYGIAGTMGKVLYNVTQSLSDVDVIFGIDRKAEQKDFDLPVFSTITEAEAHASEIDCLIDFSYKDNIYDYLPFAAKHEIPCVVATTGFSEEDIAFIKSFSDKIAILQSGNMSLGINLLLKLVRVATAALKGKADIEIIEQHHAKKLDAPSGTALLLAQGAISVNNDLSIEVGRSGMKKRDPLKIGISSVRGGTVVGKHEVIFLMGNECITLKHEAENKSIFANGSINAARFLLDKKQGFYSMEDIF